MARRIGAVLAGTLFFAVVAFLMNRLALAVWPPYAAAFPERDFTVPMLLARLTVSTVALLGSGAVAAAIARTRAAVVDTAGLMLLLGCLVHFTEPTWSSFPIWYHIAFIGSIVPLVLIGGKLRAVTPAPGRENVA